MSNNNFNEMKLRQLQLIELDALIELEKFCKQNDINFYLRGGSVLGAVKYHGFIPWDDDMDIAIPRKDYNKLIKLSETQKFSDKYTIESYKYNSNTHCYFPRLVLSEKIRKELGLPTNNLLGLVLIDILPLDGTPNNGFLRKLYYLKIYIYRALAGVCTLDINETVSMHSKKIQFILKILKFLRINKLYRQDEIYEKLETLYSKYMWEKSQYSGTITGSLGKKEIVPTNYWDKGMLVDFENHLFLIPTRFDEYLKDLYGENYMKELPPKEKRKSHLGDNKI